MRLIDLTGNIYGRLLVIQRHQNIKGRATWLCVCSCGRPVVTSADRLRRGQTQSCGCYRREKCGDLFRTHGKSKTRVHRIWRDMINRCHYKRYPERHLYGGRGIVVCDRWRHSFNAFFSDMGEPPSNRHSLDRINNDGNYEPSNCRWATATQQAANRRKKGIQLTDRWAA